MRSACRLALACAASVAIVVCSVSSVRASFTTINPPVGEESHARILSHIYGGTFSATGANNLDYTNGTILAERVEDVVSNKLPDGASAVVGTTPLDDQLWLADYKVASAQAKYAVFDQNFGYIDGATGGTYVKLFDQTGWGYNVNGSVDLSSLSGRLLRWARGGEGRVVSSQQSDNLDGMDHMVTYHIIDTGPVTEALDTTLKVPTAQIETWLLFFEDKFQGEPLADFDFNDLVVEVKAAPSTSFPEPTSLASLAGFGLLALGAFRRRS